MKSTNSIKTLALAIALSYPVYGQTETTKETTETRLNNKGQTETSTTTTTTFTPEINTKVVKYFDTYKTERHGLPPAVVSKVKIERLPAAWRTRVAPGITITEEQRDLLIPAPSDLVAVLPAAPSATHKYYMMGNNVVAVDTTTYRVVDSIQVPSIKFSAD